jgi:hypothetical protein
MSDTLRMPEHRLSSPNADGGDLYGHKEGIICRASRVPGYAHQNPDGTLHCNRCGWTTPKPVVTTYSDKTGSTYLTWEDYVAAETNGYVVVLVTSRSGTAPAVVGPWPTQPEARKAQARLRSKFKREEGPHHTVKTYVRVLSRPSTPTEEKK